MMTRHILIFHLKICKGTTKTEKNELTFKHCTATASKKLQTNSTIRLTEKRKGHTPAYGVNGVDVIRCRELCT